MYDIIVNLASMGSESDMIDAARFFENKQGHAEKAVTLFHKVKCEN